MSRIVIGVGNTMRGDDGAGILVARALSARLPHATAVFESDGDGARIVEWLGQCDAAVVVDACSSGERPGVVHTFDCSRNPLPSVFSRYSTHTFGLAEAIELARTLGQLPPHAIVVGIEGSTFSLGSDVTPPVRAAVTRVVEMLACGAFPTP